MSYIDQSFLENLVTPNSLSGAVLYGGTTVATTGSVIGQFISGASSYVDSFLEPAGYDVPLSTVPAAIQEITAWKAWEGLLIRCNTPVPDEVRQQVDHAEGFLLALSEKKIVLPNTGVNTETAPGGYSIGDASGSVFTFFTLGNMRGTFI
ncbi:MAG: DUF1320 family protein [Coleofasciculus sp. C2-GNP5-27]